jgi:hypothetical protein
MRPLVIIRAMPLFFAMTIPAFAQFPPPGIYRCNRNDAPLGTLVLNVAGDYEFIVAANSNFDAKADAGNGKGQLASAGAKVSPQSGPFKDDYKLTGAFETSPQGDTKFLFKGEDGSEVTCEP